MRSRDFAFWLQGFFELRAGGTQYDGLDAKQVATIKQHLALVFQHDPEIAAKPHVTIDNGVVGSMSDLSKILIC